MPRVREHHPQRRFTATRTALLELEQQVELGREQDREGHLLLDHLAPEVARAEAVDDGDHVALVQCDRLDGEGADGMRQRRRQQAVVRRADPEALGIPRAARAERSSGQHHPLRPPGRSGGVQDRPRCQRVVGHRLGLALGVVDRLVDVQQRATQLGQAGEVRRQQRRGLRIRDERLGRAVAALPQQFLGRQAGHERDHDGAELRDRVLNDHRLEPVAHTDQDALAGADPEFVQGTRGPALGRVERAERDRAVIGAQEHLVGRRRHPRGEHRPGRANCRRDRARSPSPPRSPSPVNRLPDRRSGTSAACPATMCPDPRRTPRSRRAASSGRAIPRRRTGSRYATAARRRSR